MTPKEYTFDAAYQPQVRAKRGTREIMLDVIIALLPALCVGVWQFGAQALIPLAVSIVSCVFFEWAYRKLMKKPDSIGDLSAVVTGILLAYTLPANCKWWLPIIGAFFAIVVVKQLYGGIGKNFLNPALAGRAFLLASYALFMTTWVVPGSLTSVIGADAMGDVALLKIDAQGLATVSIAEENTLQVGDPVIAIGNPFGELDFTMTHGYVSGLDRDVTIENTPMRMIQTDTPFNAGNSGGPLLDMNGNVVGIASAKYSGTTASGASIENVSFAVPIHDALEIAYDLQQYGYVRGRAYLGVTVRDLDGKLAADYGLPVGPRVESVTEGSCAAKAGIQQGDFILSVDGRKTETTNSLLSALLRHSAGETVGILLYRAGAHLTVAVTLDERPQTVQQPSDEPPAEIPDN